MMSGFSYQSSKGPLCDGSSNNENKHIRSQRVAGFLEAVRRIWGGMSAVISLLAYSPLGLRSVHSAVIRVAEEQETALKSF